MQAVRAASSSFPSISPVPFPISVLSFPLFIFVCHSFHPSLISFSFCWDRVILLVFFLCDSHSLSFCALYSAGFVSRAEHISPCTFTTNIRDEWLIFPLSPPPPLFPSIPSLFPSAFVLSLCHSLHLCSTLSLFVFHCSDDPVQKTSREVYFTVFNHSKLFRDAEIGTYKLVSEPHRITPNTIHFFFIVISHAHTVQHTLSDAPPCLVFLSCCLPTHPCFSFSS